MDRLRANAHAIVVALQRKFLVAAPRKQFSVNAELLRPITRDAPTHRQYPHALRGQHGVGKPLEILEGIKTQQRALILLPGNLVQREVDSQLGIAECGDKDRDVALVSGFQYAPSRCILVQIFADAAMDFPTAGDVFRAPLVEDVVHHFLDVIKIHFGLE